MNRFAAVCAAVMVMALPLCVSAQQTEHEGAEALGLALRRLGVTQRVLMIGAHPDDENTALLAELALGHGVDAAYLALTRGEGGQNLIGPELQEGLGLIRTEELLAARRLDGARQFFSRAYDFGFSKSADESFSHWPRDSVLADVVAVIRKFRPDVIVPVFSGTPRDGHGQHQVSGIVAREAFAAAADPNRFPGQIRAGLLPYQAHYMYQALYRNNDDASLRIAAGDYDPLLGRSHYQIAMASRSRHRSQDMGQSQPLGPRSVSLVVVKGDPPAGARSLFAGLDTTLAQRAAGSSAAMAQTLAEYQRTVHAARDGFNPLETTDLVPDLAAALGLLERADSLAAAAGQATTSELRFAIADERDDVNDALREAAGLVFDATANDQRVVPGQQFDIDVTLWNGGMRPLRVSELEPVLPRGWKASSTDALPAGPLAPEGVVRRRFTVTVPAAAELTEPYFLRQPRKGDMYTWPPDPSVRGLPFEPPEVRAHASVELDGQTVSVERQVEFATVDKAQGETREPVMIVPAVSVAVQPQTMVVPVASNHAEVVAADGGSGAASNEQPASAHTLTVSLRSEAPDGIKGTVRLNAPAGWSLQPADTVVAFDAPGETRRVTFAVTPPADAVGGEYAIEASFERSGGQQFERGYDVIDYPHTNPRMLYRPATTRASVFDVAVAPGLQVGYIEGAGDDGLAALRQLGVNAVALDAQALAKGDLSRYDAIVSGIRAYEVRPDLVANNRRLLDYVKNGGVFIVQYNKYEFPEGDFAPYPLTMTRPHDRVTDENAAVKLLDPENPILSWPNRISERDWQGWVQERGLYFAHTWDDHYEPLLEMHDPGEAPLRGSLLTTPYGEGTYVYTGLALFRQLPQGVPGAYRLLANLVSLGAHAKPAS